MWQKLTYSILILVLLLSCNQKPESNITAERVEYENVAADTITNWQLYKDSELLFKSNSLNSNLFTAEIKKSDKYENLILKFFCDFNTKVTKREIKLVLNDKTLATFIDENAVHAPFPIEKYLLDRIRMVKPYEDLKIVYSDAVFKDGITIGLLKLSNE